MPELTVGPYIQELLGTYALVVLLSACCFEVSDVDMLTKERYISQALILNPQLG
jgi:hypothetical protein